MALLTMEQRQTRFKFLGLGEYNKENIKKFQKKYLRSKDVDGIYGINTDNALRHVYNVKKYTTNFTPEEFKCECGGRYCTGYPSYMKKVELENLQKIRTHYGKPMTVTCGLRCRPYNNSLRGSISNSKHLTGYACDFYMKGVTDTLSNRKASIKWIKKLPNHNYTYGDGINSYGARMSASYMGNALHTDTNKPVSVAKTTVAATTTKTVEKTTTTATETTTTKILKRTKLAQCAWEYAYHTNTKKATYPSGAAKDAYKLALNKAFGKTRKWSTPAKKGASCDVFVATCIRMAGLGDAPRGMGRSWLNKSKNFKRVNVTYKTIKDGDIISIIWKNGNPHWCIAYKGYILEASYGGWYPKRTNTLKSRLSKSGKQSVVVYRALGSTTVKKNSVTETKEKEILAACEKQATYMKNYKYGWESNPTVAKSKKKGTCVTYVACVLQRAGYLDKGQYIWHNEQGKVTHAKSNMKITHPGKSLKNCKSLLKPGDVVMAGKKSDVGSGSHIFIVTGKWSGENPYIWDNHSAERIKKGKAGAHTYDGDKNVIAIVRLLTKKK